MELYPFGYFAREIVKIDSRMGYLFRKWLHEVSFDPSIATTNDFRDFRETIHIPIMETTERPVETIRTKEIIITPIVWRTPDGRQTLRPKIEMPEMTFLL